MILVTGAAGFIGSNLCEALLNEGYKVLGIDCYYKNYPKWIKDFNLRHCIGNPNFVFLEHNILDPNIGKLIEGLNITTIIHLADIPGVTACSEINFDEYIRYNIMATQKLLESVKDKGIKKLIYASSSTVYGNEQELPMSELTNTKPISLYGVTKLAGEKLCHYYGYNYGIDIDILRFFTVYGPKQRPDMAFHNFIKNILLNKYVYVYGDGTQKRDFVYVEDICKIILEIIDKNIDEEIINVGGGITLSVNESINIIEEILKKKAKIRYIEAKIDEQLITHAAMDKLDKIIKNEAKTDIYEGIEEEAKFVKQLYKIQE